MEEYDLLNMDDFVTVPLTFDEARQSNVFARKNNKTVAETLNHRRYSKLADVITKRYPGDLDQPLGEFLLSLKESGDDSYKRFLNRYGDLEYIRFFIADSTFRDRKGVYAYFIGGGLQYVGRCRDSMKKRIDNGYGKIHPKNCYLDGQATNCHLNSQIAKARGKVSLHLKVMDSDDNIVRVERTLIRQLDPPWNIQGR